MTAHAGLVRSMLEEALWLAESEGEIAPDTSWQTFREAELLTVDEGLVISMPDGSEFQVTIVQSA